jgi:predicted GH43/DUF377 family glycosyl hydrolase
MVQKYNMFNHIKFTRIGNTPLIEADPDLDWEAGGVLAPAIIHENESWKMLYRAYGLDGISRLGYAESNDGIIWKKDKSPRVMPYDSLVEYSGIEDPRVVKIGDHYFTTYTAYGKKLRFVKTRIRILETTDFRHFSRIKPTFKNHWRKNDKDGVLFPEKINGLYYMLHRLEPNIQISSSINLRKWSDHATIMDIIGDGWESHKIGAGAPPIRTPIGWLFFYHGVNEKREYSMGAAVLDLKDPTKLLYRLPFPLIWPETEYEKSGYEPNVVFGTSAIEIGSDYYLYYGAGDKVIAAASINKANLLKTIIQYPASNNAN